MNNIRIEKRLPFGFVGLWGRVYKKFSYDNSETYKNEVVELNRKNFIELGMDVQFKDISDIEKKKTLILSDFKTKAGYRTVETTDAYFNRETSEYECVVGLGDLIRLNNQWWSASQIAEKTIYTPRKQSFFYIELKNMSKEQITSVK